MACSTLRGEGRHLPFSTLSSFLCCLKHTRVLCVRLTWLGGGEGGGGEGGSGGGLGLGGLGLGGSGDGDGGGGGLGEAVHGNTKSYKSGRM